MSPTLRIPAIHGSVRQAKQVNARARTLLRLIAELAQLEARRKAAASGKAAGIGALAGVLVFYAIGFLLAAAAAALSETLALWLSLLIVAVAMLLVAFVCVLIARRFGRQAGSSGPSPAIEESKRTVEMLQGNG
jgi:putative superfamily III holin-X